MLKSKSFVLETLDLGHYYSHKHWGEVKKLTKLSALIFLLLFSFTTRSETNAKQPRSADYAENFYQQNYIITSECSGEVSPDRTFIVGGITAESLKPLDAREQMEKQIAEIKKYVSEGGGTVYLKERIRAVREISPKPKQVKIDQLPFILVQRLELEFPMDVDIDTILEQVLQLGLDRYGKNFRLGYYDNKPKVVVFYRFSNLREELEKIHQKCILSSLKKWCQANTPPVEHKACTEELSSIVDNFLTQQFMLHSQHIKRDHISTSQIQISYPWQESQLDSIELLGDVPLRLSGTITITLPKVIR